jgi:hypothetical protein
VLFEHLKKHVDPVLKVIGHVIAGAWFGLWGFFLAVSRAFVDLDHINYVYHLLTIGKIAQKFKAV